MRPGPDSAAPPSRTPSARHAKSRAIRCTQKRAPVTLEHEGIGALRTFTKWLYVGHRGCPGPTKLPIESVGPRVPWGH